MHRRQLLSMVVVTSVPLAGCAAPTAPSVTTLSDPERQVETGRTTVVYRHDDERLFEFGVAAGDPASGTLSDEFASFAVSVQRSERTAFDSLRYAFTTEASTERGVHPTVYLKKLGTTTFPPFQFVESGTEPKTLLSVEKFGDANPESFTMRFLLHEDELPTDLTVAARVGLTDAGGDRRYVAEPTATVELFPP